MIERALVCTQATKCDTEEQNATTKYVHIIPMDRTEVTLLPLPLPLPLPLLLPLVVPRVGTRTALSLFVPPTGRLKALPTLFYEGESERE